MEHEYEALDSDYVFVNRWGGELGRPAELRGRLMPVSRTMNPAGGLGGDPDLRRGELP
jgi:hypothetical protein